jgi:hypothetical protein
MNYGWTPNLLPFVGGNCDSNLGLIIIIIIGISMLRHTQMISSDKDIMYQYVPPTLLASNLSSQTWLLQSLMDES